MTMLAFSIGLLPSEEQKLSPIANDIWAMIYNAGIVERSYWSGDAVGDKRIIKLVTARKHEILAKLHSAL